MRPRDQEGGWEQGPGIQQGWGMAYRNRAKDGTMPGAGWGWGLWLQQEWGWVFGWTGAITSPPSNAMQIKSACGTGWARKAITDVALSPFPKSMFRRHERHTVGTQLLRRLLTVPNFRADLGTEWPLTLPGRCPQTATHPMAWSYRVISCL